MNSNMSDQSGFTLVEVLVVAAIIGILSSLALPIFAVYKADAFNSRAMADLKNAITAEEAVFESSNSYQPCGPSDCGDVLEGYSAGAGVSVSIVVNPHYFSIATCHMNGSKEFRWDSLNGQYQIIEYGIGSVCTPAPTALP